MNELMIFMLPGCPHCRLALSFVDKLMAGERYKGISVKLVDESREAAFAEGFDYFYVPSFYYNGQKLHEGHAELEDVRRVLDAVTGGGVREYQPTA